MKPERDIYFQKALEEGFLARSAYKLLQIDEVFDIFNGVTKAIDLCSAPGSWTQVIYNKLHGVVNNYDSSRLNPNVKIVSVDMMPMDHFPGVIHLQADISQYSTMKTIIEEFHGERSDIIVCDGAIDVVGMKLLDYYMHHRIFLPALYIVLNTLKTGGTFVIKIFIDKGHKIFIEKLNLFFQNVCVVKPDCSRNKEAFAVCQDFLPLPGFDPVELTSYIELKCNDFSKLTGVNAKVIPYLCVDYPLSEDIYITNFRNFSASKTTQDVYNMIDCILKDSQTNKKILTKRVLQKPLIYQITKDNRLQFDRGTEDFLFKDFSKQKDPVKVENIFDQDYVRDAKCFSNNSVVPSNTKSNFKNLQGERLKINTVLGEKIKEIELKNKGKFSGLGFNLEDWKFFTATFEKCDNQNTNKHGVETIYKDFEEISNESESSPHMNRNKYIKSLYVKQEALKSKVRSHIKSDSNEGVS